MLAFRFVTVVASAITVLGHVITSPEELIKRQEGYHWVSTWTNMPQLVEQGNLPPAPFLGSGVVFRDATLRQTFQMSIGGPKIRVVFSNTFGGTDLPITSANVALPTGGNAGVGGIQTNTLKPITFNGGSASAVVARGKTLISDEIDFPIVAQQNIAVTMYLQQGQSGTNIDGHPGSRTTSWMAQGNRARDANVSGGSTVHWYFMSAVQTWAPAEAGALAILGDSITDGRGSDDNKNNRWPNLLLARLQASGYTQIAVCNQAAGGNRVLADGLGPSLISRYTRDAIQLPGVKWVMIFEGVNDIGGVSGGQAQQIAQQLINAFKQIVRDAKAVGLPVFGATITPFQGSQYGDATREQARQTVNNWILTSGTFDATIDFAKFIANPSNPAQLAQAYNGGDSLHPNVAGYQQLANQFPIDIFKAVPAPTLPPPVTTQPPITTPPPVTTQPPITTPPPVTTTTTASGPQQTRYGQCGGRGFTGPTECVPPYVCTVSNEWYSQCL